MMIMTAKVNFKKIILILAAIAAVIIGILAAVGNPDAETTSATAISGNDARVKFLTDFGWDVTTSPVESSQVRIPESTTELYSRYNQLQKSQGYDLTAYGGKNVMRYVYQVNNYPGATEPVYATLLVYKNKVIGGDITDTAAKGAVRGFKKAEKSDPEKAPAPVPSDSPAA